MISFILVFANQITEVRIFLLFNLNKFYLKKVKIARTLSHLMKTKEAILVKRAWNLSQEMALKKCMRY
jgi:hypothetical protein